MPAVAAVDPTLPFGGELNQMAVGAENIPQVILDATQYIRANGLSVEGIFRRSALQQTVKDVKALYNKGNALISLKL